MMSTQEPVPEPDASGDPEAAEVARQARLARVRTWLSAITLIVLAGGAAMVFAVGYGFFGVVLGVLAVFAAVDLTATVRRGARR